jgi:hypothetical protein
VKSKISLFNAYLAHKEWLSKPLVLAFFRPPASFYFDLDQTSKFSVARQYSKLVGIKLLCN